MSFRSFSVCVITRWCYFCSSVMITRFRYCLSPTMISRWHYYIDAVMITRWRYCVNVVMITRWRYCLSAAMITRGHYCISVEMVTGWVHWIVNVSNAKELWTARRLPQHIPTARRERPQIRKTGWGTTYIEKEPDGQKEGVMTQCFTKRMINAW